MHAADLQYDLEIGRAVDEIKSTGAKKVLIQLPDGLKPAAEEIQAAIEKETDAEVLLWLGSCYGSCDVPVETKALGVDLLLAWGHPAWRFD
ncbi:MAG: diphthamide synthesis protein [archaeon]